MGAAGDMLTSALLELMPDPSKSLDALNSLGVPGVQYTSEKTTRCGLAGTRMHVTVHGHEEGEEDHTHDGHTHEHEYEYEHDNHAHEHAHEGHTHEHHTDQEHEHSIHGHHTHSAMQDIEHIISDLRAPEAVKKDALCVYGLIADAESHAHGVPVSNVHFHEVGAMDAVADVVAVSYLLHELAPDEIVCSPVHVGSGTVQCAHGVLPVPAPATAWILRGIPIYGGQIQSELCTPTGAALLKHYTTRFSDLPAMVTHSIGYGMGKKDFAQAPNCVRAMLGETSEPAQKVCELLCNVDDMTGEAIGFALERFLEAGALDAYTVPIGMKKSRPGVLVCLMCLEQNKDEMMRQMFTHTTTLGVRVRSFDRHTLRRETQTVDTLYGPVRVKKSQGYGVSREKFEYEDLARIAKEQNISFSQAQQLLADAADQAKA